MTSVISESVTAAAVEKGDVEEAGPDALMEGYRAVFWALFVLMVLVFGTGAVGLRKVGKIGAKLD